LGDCWIRHPACFQAAIPSMPKRLIDVGLANGSVRLCESKIRARYLTLSHCWGEGQVAMTTTLNFQDRCQEITMSSLSKVFQEAIKVTRFFGIRYIWIDSLCIIQDSRDDWEQESAKMCTIYQNALFTIAASRATTGSEGLLSQTPIHLTTPCFLPQYNFTSAIGNRINIHLAPSDKNDDPNTFVNKIDGPLHDRAWVLQEEMLSHATLAFTEAGMSWQCFSCTRSSLDPEGSNDTFRMSYLQDAIMLRQRYSRRPEILALERTDWQKQHGNMIPFQSKRDGIYADWAATVEKYLMRKVTYPSDRLPALSGVVQGMQEVLSDSYSLEQCVAGTWMYDLPRQLLWSPHWTIFQSSELLKAYEEMGGEGREKQKIRPPRKYVAPSWSWASMYETPISWGNHFWNRENEEEREWFSMLGADWDADGKSIYGNLAKATLTMQGNLMRAFVWDDGMVYESGQRRFKLGKLLLDEGGTLDGIREGGSRDVILMPVLSFKRVQTGYGIAWHISALVLLPTGIKHGEFRRIGLGLMFEKDVFDGGPQSNRFFLV
ncbi:heterokaryon incompatibility protein-domain-containing protein, partial [Bisporella sp. PMI_857]